MLSTTWKFNLGDKVKCQVTGLVGIIDMRAECLNGCHRYSVNAGIGKDGKMKDSYWIDGGQLSLVKAKIVEVEKTKTGGPMTISRGY